MSKSATAKILEAVGILKGEDPKLVSSILTDQGLEKAAQDLTPSEHVKDRWESGEMHKNPTKEELRFGPTEESSGGGAEKMVRDYSHPAKQEGIQLLAENLGKMFGSMSTSMKALAEGQGAILDMLKAKDVPATKAKKADDGDDDEEKEVVEINEDKCKSFLLRANDCIRKAGRLVRKAEDAKDDGDESAAKSFNTEARKLRKSASFLLAKARTHAYAAGSDILKADIRKAATKGEIEITEDEEEGEDEKESDKAKAASPAAPAAAKADENDKGNQADKKDEATGNQDDHAKAAQSSNADVLKALNDALAGNRALETTVKGLMDVVSGKSKISDMVPDLTKARPEIIKSINEKLVDAEEAGTMSEFEIASARNIIAKSEAAKKGLLASSIVGDLISKAPPTVRNLFIEPVAA